MNLRQIDIFLAVADTGSFSRGAEATLLTQSTVSQHIATLEDEIGIRLLDRTGRGAVLTGGGKLFLRHARRVRSELAALEQAMAGFRGLANAPLAVAASNIPADYLIPEILTSLAARHPGIVLSVLSGDSRGALDRLLGGEVELAVLGSRFAAEGVDFTALATDRLHLMVGAQHPWRGRESVRLEELAQMPTIARESGSGSGRALHEALRGAGFDPARLRVAVRLGGNEAVKQAVASGFGFAFLSELSVGRERERGDLHAVAVQGLQVERRLWLARRDGRSLSPAAEAFAVLLRQRCQDEAN
ncbi:MAG: LysR family transcriptional regulator [Desulfuromonadales bacterium]